MDFATSQPGSPPPPPFSRHDHQNTVGSKRRRSYTEQGPIRGDPATLGASAAIISAGGTFAPFLSSSDRRLCCAPRRRTEPRAAAPRERRRPGVSRSRRCRSTAAPTTFARTAVAGGAAESPSQQASKAIASPSRRGDGVCQAI